MAILSQLWLTTEQTRQIATHAAAKPTEEVCGLLFGWPLHQPPVAQIVPVENVAVSPAARYEMHPAQLVTAYTEALRSGLELLAIYHSHPKSPPIPSQTDVAEAHYPDAVYLIVSLTDGEAQFAAWSITDEVTSVPLLITDQRPDLTAPEAVMSPAQKVAVILSALLAAVFLIVVSLSLLPPAPPLPN